MYEKVKSISTYILTLERDTPYLGPLAEGESINSAGYLVRKGNGTIYPSVDRSVLVRIETHSGVTGWGETYGLCAPKATCEIINDLLAPVLKDVGLHRPEETWNALYDLMRVRGYTGGFMLDAIAAVDIAIWDIFSKTQGLSLSGAIGGEDNKKVGAYVSGLPKTRLDDRVSLARDWIDSGFDAIKFAAVVSHDGIQREAEKLRTEIGDAAELMVDLHWKFSGKEALDLLKGLEQFDLKFAEAPVKSEDIDALECVSEYSSIPIAVGEEWRTDWDAELRLNNCAVKYVQPEMGHTGVTQFLKICDLAESNECEIAPHATVGFGFFLGASLHAFSTRTKRAKHEYQHSIMDRNLEFVETDMECARGQFTVPTGLGLGVEPREPLWSIADLVS